MARTIFVQCPKCQELLEVNVETTQVVHHFVSKKKADGSDLLQDQLSNLKKEAVEREKKFEQAKSGQGDKLNKLDELFNKEAQKIKKDGKIEKPKNIFDAE